MYWGCVQGRTGDDRVYRGSVQWHTGDVQGVTVKTQGVTGEDRGFSYGQGFLKSVVLMVKCCIYERNKMYTLVWMFFMCCCVQFGRHTVLDLNFTFLCISKLSKI